MVEQCQTKPTPPPGTAHAERAHPAHFRVVEGALEVGGRAAAGSFLRTLGFGAARVTVAIDGNAELVASDELALALESSTLDEATDVALVEGGPKINTRTAPRSGRPFTVSVTPAENGLG